MVIQPWQLGTSAEELIKLQDPYAGIKNLATALVSGQNAYTEGQANQLKQKQSQMAMQPRQMVKLNADGTGYESVGRPLQPNEEITKVPVPETTKIAIPQYDEKGKIVGYNMQEVAGAGKDVKLATNPSGMSQINNKDIASDPIWKDKARRAASGLISSSEIMATGARYPELKTKFDDMVNKESLSRYGKDFNIQDLIKREKWERATNNQRVVEYDKIARNTIDDLIEHTQEAKRLQIPFIDKYLAGGAINMGGVTYKDVESLRAVLVEEVAQVFSGGGVPSDKAMDLGQKIVGDWNTDDQVKSSLTRVKERLDNKADIFKEAGVSGGFKDGNEGSKTVTKTINGITYKKVQGGWEAQ